MIHRRGLLVAATFIAAPWASGVERLPIEDFARDPETAHVRLAPDGKHYGFLRDHRGVAKLHVADVENKVITRLNVGSAALLEGVPKEVVSFSWVNDRRLVVTTGVWDFIYGVMATDLDGEHTVSLSGYEDDQENWQGNRLFVREIVHRFLDPDGTLLMLDRHEDGVGSENRPDIMTVNTSTGLARTILKNPGEVARWSVDFRGVPRLGVLSHGDLSGAIYREDERTPWRTLLPLQDRRETVDPLGFDAANNRLLVRALTERRRWTILPLDPVTGQTEEPLLTHDEYDIMPNAFTPAIAGIALSAPIFSRKKEALIGLRYVTDAPRTKWLDPEFAKYQMAIDRALPDTVNILADASKDERQLLWFGYSDQNPGVYMLLDLDKRSLKRMAVQRSWIKPAQMAPMLSIKYAARDGLTIHGFLTVPVGHQPKGLPMIIMPHGGPWVRDVWGYDPLVQLLANRGYAVLQMDYRGSTGYGLDLLVNAKREIGGKIQDDIEDGTRWAIASGVADPQRIAIMGMSYGGYSTLFALGHSDGLYRCGISIAGVTDWLAFFEDSDVADYKMARLHWREQLGDPKGDQERLRMVSPVTFADRIKAPLLIIQGNKDRRVPPDQAKRMIAALTKSGRAPETLFLSEVGHNYGDEKKRLQIYQAVAGFLERNLGPGVK